MRLFRLLSPLALLALAASPLHADWATEKKEFEDSFRNRPTEARVSAIASLKEFDHVEGARLLLTRFKNEMNETVLLALAGKICDLGDPEAREELRRAVLGEKDPKVRAKCCRIFSAGRGLDRVEVLKKLLGDRVAEVKVSALAVLGAPDGLLTEAVAGLVKDQPRDVRKEAIGALSRIATLACVDPLIAVLEHDPDKGLRDAAVASLSRITDRSYGSNCEAWRAWSLKHRVVDLAQADHAIQVGAEYLRLQLRQALRTADADDPESVGGDSHIVPVLTYALIHSSIDRADPTLKAGIDVLVQSKLDGTYNMSIAALALADLDPEKYADRLAELAQLLCDQQNSNGQWGYGTPARVTQTPGQRGTVPGEPSAVESGPEGARTEPRTKIAILWKNFSRVPGGDNSNTQFAILGLRATTEAGCVIPREVWENSLDWFQKCQQDTGGWDYREGASPYWSMTCCGLTSTTICLHALGKDTAFRNGKPLDVDQIKRGSDWLDKNWMRLDDRSGASKGAGGWGFFYDLYSLERVGMIVGLEKIGDHDWYSEGGGCLLGSQQKDGSWAGNPVDTAFAILFLKRATKGYAVSPQDDK